MTDDRPRCAVLGCKNSANASRGWCGAHYQRWLKYGNPYRGGEVQVKNKGLTCSVEDCEKSAAARGWCEAHYARWRKWGSPTGSASDTPKPIKICSVEGCETIIYGGPTPAKGCRGMCLRHYNAAARREAAKNPCVAPGCERGAFPGPLQLCKGHSRLYRAGQPIEALGRYTSVPLDVAGEGQCCACLRMLPPDQFVRRPETTRGYDYQCRECSKWDRLLKKYSLTRAEYDDLWRSQGYGCAICGANPTGRASTDRRHVDHDHSCCPGSTSCGECVRGILCWSCNCHLVAGYEKLPDTLRDSATLNEYLTRRPIKKTDWSDRRRGRRKAGEWRGPTQEAIAG